MRRVKLWQRDEGEDGDAADVGRFHQEHEDEVKEWWQLESLEQAEAR